MPKAKKQPSCISTQTSLTSRFPPAPGPDLTSLSVGTFPQAELCRDVTRDPAPCLLLSACTGVAVKARSLINPTISIPGTTGLYGRRDVPYLLLLQYPEPTAFN